MGTINVIKGGHRRAYHQGAGHTLPHFVGYGNDMSEDAGASSGAIKVNNPTAFMQLVDKPEGALGEPVAVYVPDGSVILMSNIIPHKGGTNKTDVMRWSWDMRWIDARMPAGFPTVPVLRGSEPAGWSPDYEMVGNRGPNLKHPWTDHKTTIHIKQAERRRKELEAIKNKQT